MKKTFLLALLGSLILSCQKSVDSSADIVPKVASVKSTDGHLSLSDGFYFDIQNPELDGLADIFANDHYMLTGIKNGTSKTATSIAIDIDQQLGIEEYELTIDEQISLKGGSYAATSMGLVSILQLLDEQQQLPKISIKDKPENGYRSLMIDLARGWHDIGVLKEIITLCKWYKINYLHLHLTDDQSFTFPSTAFPALVTKDRSFTLEGLKELNEYAHDRGVTLVPEIDVPGHSTQFIRKMPDLFGIGDPKKNSYTISMGKEVVYEALNTIIDEIADVFKYSPYIHIGGDEAFFTGMEDDPETLAYMKNNNIPNLDELFRHFLVRLNDMVRSNGKQTIVWAGFGEEGEIEIPKNIITMLWESQYYDPQQLIDDGFQVINASFKPLYVVNNRKWEADHIYSNWNLRRWESWGSPEPNNGVEVIDKNNQLMGATMCVWEQNQINQIHRLRERLPAMVEHLWFGDANELTDFKKRLANTDKKLTRLLKPFEVHVTGKNYPEMTEGNFYEHL